MTNTWNSHITDLELDRMIAVALAHPQMAGPAIPLASNDNRRFLRFIVASCLALVITTGLLSYIDGGAFSHLGGTTDVAESSFTNAEGDEIATLSDSLFIGL